jgi:hypothetical protein
VERVLELLLLYSYTLSISEHPAAVHMHNVPHVALNNLSDTIATFNWMFCVLSSLIAVPERGYLPMARAQAKAVNASFLASSMSTNRH